MLSDVGMLAHFKSGEKKKVKQSNIMDKEIQKKNSMLHNDRTGHKIGQKKDRKPQRTKNSIRHEKFCNVDTREVFEAGVVITR